MVLARLPSQPAGVVIILSAGQVPARRRPGTGQALAKRRLSAGLALKYVPCGLYGRRRSHEDYIVSHHYLRVAPGHYELLAPYHRGDHTFFGNIYIPDGRSRYRGTLWDESTDQARHSTADFEQPGDAWAVEVVLHNAAVAHGALMATMPSCSSSDT